jgi:hypothetical protein
MRSLLILKECSEGWLHQQVFLKLRFGNKNN